MAWGFAIVYLWRFQGFARATVRELHPRQLLARFFELSCRLTPRTTSTSPPAVAASRLATCELQLSFVESQRKTPGISVRMRPLEAVAVTPDRHMSIHLFIRLLSIANHHGNYGSCTASDSS